MALSRGAQAAWSTRRSRRPVSTSSRSWWLALVWGAQTEKIPEKLPDGRLASRPSRVSNLKA